MTLYHVTSPVAADDIRVRGFTDLLIQTPESLAYGSRIVRLASPMHMALWLLLRFQST